MLSGWNLARNHFSIMPWTKLKCTIPQKLTCVFTYLQTFIYSHFQGQNQSKYWDEWTWLIWFRTFSCFLHLCIIHAKRTFSRAWEHMVIPTHLHLIFKGHDFFLLTTDFPTRHTLVILLYLLYRSWARICRFFLIETLPVIPLLPVKHIFAQNSGVSLYEYILPLVILARSQHNKLIYCASGRSCRRRQDGGRERLLQNGIHAESGRCGGRMCW